MAQLAKKPCKGDWTFSEGWSERHEEQLAELQKESQAVDPNKSLVGALVSFPIADGYATYRVAKDKPLTLEHVPYGDAYQVPYVMIRGLRRVDVIRQIAGQKKLQQLFG